MTYKIDLHTHSVASPDGSLSLQDYEAMLKSGSLQYIAITDHDRVDFALDARTRLGEAIIIGQEVTTIEGELIGLFLKKAVPAGKTAMETAELIHAQGGLVYVPHPFETVRKGVTQATLYKISDMVDVIEIHNGRALFQNRSHLSEEWLHAHPAVAGAASSDAHGRSGWGRTYSEIPKPPLVSNLVRLLHHARYRTELVGIRGALYPKLNRLRKRFGNA